jgi:hypothetical protein
LAPRKRGPKSNPEAEAVSRLSRENARLTRQLEKAELIIEAQKKLSEILGITLEQETGDEAGSR